MMGIVFCGGQSLRMGKDKGLLLFGTGGKVWAEFMQQKFSEISLPSVLSINSRQREDYNRYFNDNNLLIDDPQINIQGPVLGLLTAHLKYPSHDLMVLACDLINMNVEVLRKLLYDYETLKPAAIAYKTDHIEPLCAIYSSPGLSHIFSLLTKNQLTRTSMTHVLHTLNAVTISIPENWMSCFKNLNSVDDLR